MTTSARGAVLAVVFSAVSAWAWGPVVEAGGMVAGHAPDASSTTDYRHFGGLATSVGVELGNRFNHELALEWAQLSDLTPSLAYANTMALRYTFSVDFFGKHGFTPTLGVGVAVGRFEATGSRETVDGVYLAGRLLVGVKYTFSFGLGLRADLVGSVYGLGNFGLLPSLGLSWRF